MKLDSNKELLMDLVAHFELTDSGITGKTHGGGVCLYVNERWCKTVAVREHLCTKDIEMLTVSLRPHDLPREFPQIFVAAVYIHPKANVKSDTEHIKKSFMKYQLLSPDALIFIMGHLNNCVLEKIYAWVCHVSS